MFCTQCGQQLLKDDRFCYACGAPVAPPPKRARLWPAALALVLIFALGFSVFLLAQPNTGMVNGSATPWFTVQNGVLYFNSELYTGSAELTVPETIDGQKVTAIADNCFSDCTGLVMIYLPATITHIGEGAFNGCSNLRGMKLPESLVSIGNYAFSGCVSLEAVCIPNTLKLIGGNLFDQCSKLVYFFYAGSLENWLNLPLGNLRPDSYVYCADGIYPAT